MRASRERNASSVSNAKARQAAARNSRRLYEKLTRAGLRKVSLWVCRENESLIERLRTLDLRRPLTRDAFRSVLSGKSGPKLPATEAAQGVLPFDETQDQNR